MDPLDGLQESHQNDGRSSLTSSARASARETTPPKLALVLCTVLALVPLVLSWQPAESGTGGSPPFRKPALPLRRVGVGEASSATEGYYKDVFMDGGYALTSRTTLPAADSLGLSLEYVATGDTDTDRARQNRLLVSNPGIDDNGLLLYPDGAPRFRIVYMNGGSAGTHGNSLEEAGRQRLRDFFHNGGSYTGSCAGAFIASLHYSRTAYLNGPDGRPGTRDDNTPHPNYLHLWPGIVESSGLESRTPDLEPMPGMATHPFWQMFPSLQDGWVSDCSFNSGPKNARDDTGDLAAMAKTEFLARYNLPDEPVLHLGRSVLAYKRDELGGRLVIIGCHPEGATSGEKLDLMKAILFYALQGAGEPRLKASLSNGETRLMNNNAASGFEKIGDRQYHHFTIDIPEGTDQLEVQLDGTDGYDLDLFLNHGDFAFEPQADYRAESSGADERLAVTDPAPGTWYVGIKLLTTVTYNKDNYDNFYSGNTAVLNGIPYAISAGWSSRPRPSQEVLRAPWPTIIDGQLTEYPSTPSFQFSDSSGRGSQDNLTRAWAMWDDTHLYLAFGVSDSQLHSQVAEHDGRVWQDDAVEVFIDPLNNDGPAFASDDYRIAVNPLNAVMDSRGSWDDLAAWDGSALTQASFSGSLNDDADTDAGYAVELSIPWSDLGLVPAPGLQIGFDLAVDDRDDVASGYQYSDWADLADFNQPFAWGQIILSSDLAPTPTFADVPFDHPFHDEIEALRQAGYTAGCNTNPPMYCPDNTMNRAEAAVFVERGIHGIDGLPPQPTYQTFSDLPLDSWAAKWAEALWLDHYTAGCGTDPLIFCPWQGHTRAEGCVFFLHMLNGADYQPPPPSQQTFIDVPLDTWYAGWVQAGYDAGLLEPCQTAPELRFCPNDPLTRALAAHMMIQAKGLP